MITEIYAYIFDEDRKVNAQKFDFMPMQICVLSNKISEKKSLHP